MPLTFIDIEKQKTWRIWIFLLVLIVLYFAVILACALPFFPHAAAISTQFLFSALLIALAAAGTHFWFSASDTVATVLQGLDAQPPDSKDAVHQVLINVMQEMHTVTGNKRRIRCAVIPTLSLNALAAADLKGNAVIAITEGLLSKLSRPQLESVVAHEANHVLAGDCLETTVAASLFGTLSAFVDKITDTSRGRSFFHPAFFLAWLLLFLSNLLNMFISREREYRADAAAVRMTRNPIALAETLHLLSRGWRGAGFIGSGYEMLCIVNPNAAMLDESEGFWADLISTHPPIRKRIDILLRMAHMSIAELKARTAVKTSQITESFPPSFFAMNPQQQWQGPFTLPELSALPWLSPLTWITNGDKQAAERAWKQPLINAIFVSQLSQDDKTASDFTCPVCRQPLRMETYEGTQIYQCLFCAGTLVDTPKIPRILARAGRDQPCSERIKALACSVQKENQIRFTRQKLTGTGKSPVPLYPCPKCKNPMYRGFYSGAYLVEIDRCSLCGITWFDQDELNMLQCLTTPADPQTS